MILRLEEKDIFFLKRSKVYNRVFVNIKMEQQQVQKPAVPAVQTKTTNTSPSTPSSTPLSTPSQEKSVNVPAKKSSKWWLWMLIGAVIGAVVMWAVLSL